MDIAEAIHVDTFDRLVDEILTSGTLTHEQRVQLLADLERRATQALERGVIAWRTYAGRRWYRPAWSEIAVAVGMSKSGAHKRFAHLETG